MLALVATYVLLLLAPTLVEAGVPLQLIAVVAGAGAVHLIHSAIVPHRSPRSAPVAIRKSSEYRTEATRELFELELDAHADGQPIVVIFADPNRLPGDNAFDLATDDDPAAVLEALLGEQFRTFWDEWRKRPVEEINNLIRDVMSHYGAEPGKLERSRR